MHQSAEIAPSTSKRPSKLPKLPAWTRRGLSITQKLVALIALTSGAIVLLLASYFPAQQIREARSALERKAATYGRLVSKQVASAIAFDDRETAREVFDSVAQDSDVESMVLMTATGATLHAHGVPGAWIAAAKRGVIEQRVVDLDDRIGVVSPVVSAEGPRGTLVIELTTRGLIEAKAKVVRTAALAGGLALIIGSLLAYVIARSLGRRLDQIAEVASAVTEGSLDQQPVAVKGGDEIALLGHAFNAMLAHIRSLVEQIKRNALEEQTRLEGLVSARTHELDQRNADMRLVLDNVDQGFFTVDLAGKLSRQRSAIATRWLGEPKDDDTLFSWLDRKFPGKGEYFRVAWDELTQDWMPLEMRIEQLPREFEAGGQFFEFAYQPVLEDGALTKVLVVLTDVTALVEKKRVEEDDQELAQAVRKLLDDSTGFAEFIAEAGELVAAITSHETATWQRMRHLHTLKGNAAIFGFRSLSRMCHDLETHALERQGEMAAAEISRLQGTWTRLQERVQALTQGRANVLELPLHDYEHFKRQVAAGAPRNVLMANLVDWKLEPTEVRLSRLAEYARGLAERLEKNPIEVRVESNGVRLDPHAWTSFWQALVHVVRNAVDHGLETPDERRRQDKPEAGRLVLRSVRQGDQLRIEVEDQGRGIVWERVAAAAKRRGLRSATVEDLRDALLADGLSTCESVSEISGRGIGLSAIKQACTESGGRIVISSEPGRGTTFSFDWTLDEGCRPALHLDSVVVNRTQANDNSMVPLKEQ